MSETTIVSLRDQDVLNRKIDLDDYLFGLAPDGTLPEALKSKTLRQIIRIFYSNPPDAPSDPQKKINLAALGFADIDGLQAQINGLKARVHALQDGTQ